MATNMYLKFENPEIRGTCTTPGHEGEIEILSWNHGFVQPTSPTRPETADHASHQKLTITKYIDDATNLLLKYCWTGKEIGKATLRFYSAYGVDDDRQVEYLRVVMEHVIIANYSISGGPGDIPVENIAFDYGIIQYNYEGWTRADASSNRDRSVKHNLKMQRIE